jgi:hypothetical protein
MRTRERTVAPGEWGGPAPSTTYCPADAGWPAVLDCRADMGHTYGLSWSWALTLDFFDAQSP